MAFLARRTRAVSACTRRRASVEHVPLLATASLTTSGLAEHVAPHVLPLAQRPDQILEGELYASSSRLDWRTLLKRTFDVDLRACVRCGGKLTARAVLTDSGRFGVLDMGGNGGEITVSASGYTARGSMTAGLLGVGLQAARTAYRDEVDSLDGPAASTTFRCALTRREYLANHRDARGARLIHASHRTSCAEKERRTA